MTSTSESSGNQISSPVKIDSTPPSGTNVGNDDRASFNVALKILVSNSVAGSIIGRAGSTISELQSLSGSRIKLSQAGECFPSTNERICLVQGTIERLKAGINLVLQRFILNDNDEKDDGTNEEGVPMNNMLKNSNSPATDSHVATYQVRILIPSSACGLLIGRSGRHIKSISTASQTRIQLGQKEELSSITTSERIFTIQGKAENILQCVNILIDCIEKEMQEVGGVEENSVWRYINMTTGYGKAMTGTVGNGRAYGGRVILPRENAEKMMDSTVQGSGLLHGQVVGSQLPPSNPQQLITNMDTVGVVACNADKNVQGQHHVGLDFNIPHNSASAGAIASAAAQLQQISPVELFNVEETAEGNEKKTHTVTLAIPDPLIGSIIGHNGSTLNQLQLCSETRIQISQRGEHVPGTNHRVVRITGNTKENCDAAQFWIRQTMARAQSNLENSRSSGAQRRRFQGRGSGRGPRVASGERDGNDGNNVRS